MSEFWCAHIFKLASFGAYKPASAAVAFHAILSHCLSSGTTYDQKADMYSLGIILFELWQPPFGTGMERINTVVALRDHLVPTRPSLCMHHW